MPQQQLTAFDITSLAEIDDGSLAVAYKRQILIAARDILDRPRSKKKRRITVHLDLIGLCDDDGELRGVAIEAELIPTKIPNYVTHPIKAKATANGLQFNPDSPDDVHQTTIEID